MKKILAIVAALTLFTACKKEDHGDTNVHITGNIKGFKQGRLFIRQYKDSSLVTIDTIPVDGDSNFESHLKMDGPDMLYLVIDRGTTESIDDNLMFFAEPGNVTIDTRLDYFYAQAKIKAGPNQEKFAEYEKMIRRYTDTNLELVAKNMEATKQGDATRLDSIAKAMDNNTKRRYLFTANYALNNGKYEVAPYIVLKEIPDINLKYLDTISKSMAPKVAASKYGKVLNEYVKERHKSGI